MDIQKIIGRERQLFVTDVTRHEIQISEALKGARVLVYGGAGSIGKEIVKQIFRRGPAALHVADLGENNLVELVRDLRSSIGHTGGETAFLPLDMCSVEMRAFLSGQDPYDYVLNLAAMKHVRSEKDEFSLMRMIKINVLNTLETLVLARETSARKYFAVSTDKAKNPANLMGATKRIMEDILFREDTSTAVSTARFANVAFSEGSLLHGFRQRLANFQPIAAPLDVRRYFVTGPEAGLLCLVSLLLAGNREIVFPKLDEKLELLSFSDIALRFLAAHNFQGVPVDSEEEARNRTSELIKKGKWPCYFFNSDTSGEKAFEEFYSEEDVVDQNSFIDIGVIHARALAQSEHARVENFLTSINLSRTMGNWSKAALIAAIQEACPELSHLDTGKFLDQKM